MDSSDHIHPTEDSEIQPKPAKRQRKVSFSANVGVDPNTCITLRLVHSPKDMEEGLGRIPEFAPDFAERLFGEDGKIYGYKDLKIIIWFHALSFYAHVEILHSEIMQESSGGMQKVTDVKKAFKELLGEGLIEDREAFLQELSSNASMSDVIHQHGKRLFAWKMSNEPNKGWIKAPHDSTDVGKEILLVDDLTISEVNDWHSRLTPLALLFIEAATPIDKKDPRWEVYVCLEKESNELVSQWRLVGFCTVYRFFRYPDSTRLRVSQILVLPPYQHQQNGVYLLEAVYKTALERGSFEVTMEEPSNDLQVVRECMDTMRLITFEPVRLGLYDVLRKLLNCKPQPVLTNPREWMPSHDLVEKVKQGFKICKLQFLYCWQVLIYLHMMHRGNEAVAVFRSLISSFVKTEVFGSSKSSNVGKHKQLVDVENEYDSSRTFVMFKVKQSPMDTHDGVAKKTDAGSAHLDAAVDMDPEGQLENAYQELLEEREEEINQVAEKVLQHLKKAGITLVDI